MEQVKHLEYKAGMGLTSPENKELILEFTPMMVDITKPPRTTFVRVQGDIVKIDYANEYQGMEVKLKKIPFLLREHTFDYPLEIGD